MRKFIDIYVPISKCNLNCHYCYVPQQGSRNIELEPIKYSAKQIGKALSEERLGGICHFNVCGIGETLILEEIVEIVHEILAQGHYVMIVTNGTLSQRFREFGEFDTNLRKRLGFKFSFHYLELKRTKMMDTFFENIDYVKKRGMSFSLEMTPNDEIEEYIDEIKELCMNKVGAFCHLTIPRDMTKKQIVLLSKHSFEQFVSIWSCFESSLFDFKASVWGKHRNEFCYAGEWSGILDLSTGCINQCYGRCQNVNILDNPESELKLYPIGNCCPMPHCFNSHSLLALGNIPSIMGDYSLERDRIDSRDGSHWLNDDMRAFLSHRLEDYNEEYSIRKKIVLDIRQIFCVIIPSLISSIYRRAKRFYRKR